MPDEPVRVYELARELGLTSAEALERLSTLSDHAPRSHSASVAPETAEALRRSLRRTPQTTARQRTGLSASHGQGETRSPEEGAQLILAAFERARDTGRDDWTEMTVAVLKNRILDLTQRQFDEADWGAQSFSAFVRQYPEVVAMDSSVRPPRVQLVSELPATPTTAPNESSRPDVMRVPAGEVMQPERRIRKDLWTAIMDFTSGSQYVWDGERAVPVDPNESRTGDLVLPTISAATFQEWRAAFVAEHSAGAPSFVAEQLTRWVDERLPSGALRGPLRRRWNAELKAKVLRRLEEWFSEHQLELPDGLIVTSGESTSDDALRDLVIRCVRAMTRAELEELRLPPAAVLRATR